MAKRKSAFGEPEELTQESTQEATVAPEVTVAETPEGLPLPPIPDAIPEGVPHAETGISDPLLVLRLAYFQEKIIRLRAQEQGYTLMFENRRRELEEQKRTTMLQVTRDVTIAESEYRGIQREIEKKHEISLKDFTFDPETGKLNSIVSPAAILTNGP